MKKPIAKLIPLLARGVMPGAAAATGLLSPLALAAPGDLDPGFGDVGRLGPILNGPVWAIEPLDDGTIVVAGGDLEPACGYSYYYCYYYSYYDDGFSATNFVSELTDTGTIHPGFNADVLANSQVLDVVRQPDGEIVAVGRTMSTTSKTSQLIVFRLTSNGPLDDTFGTDGIFELSIADHGDRHSGTSVLLDPDGRIVVAGSRDDQLIVLRLLPDGSFDDSFGSSGVFVGADNYDYSDDYSGARTNIQRTAAGGYRVTVSNSAGCQIVALTADGALDNAFGTSGISTVDTPLGPSTSCSSMVTQADGRLLVAGDVLGQGFAARFLANGQADPSFSANTVLSAMTSATALALAEDGSIVVASTGVNGASVMRLQASGELDAFFGNAGSTLIDLPSEYGASPIVHDMSVRPDGSVEAAGDYYPNQAFVIQLLGTGGGDSPGVLGVTQQSVIRTAEGSDEVAVNLRRTGGDSGSVSVAYETVAENWEAVDGEDYVAVSGRLTWQDGDTTEQEIRVPILADGSTEEFEYFRVTLSDPQGGAGLATRNANVEIAADGGPFGQFAIQTNSIRVGEAELAQIGVYRNYYNTGAVSVTLTPMSGTAVAGVDFLADPVTLSWADGDASGKYALFTTLNDTTEELSEHFTVELTNPTGGALIGPRSSVVISIEANDQPPPGSSGGGAFGYLSLLLLGLTTFLRFARMAFRAEERGQ